MIWTGVVNFVFSLLFGFGIFPVALNSDLALVNLKAGAPLAPWSADIARRAAVLAADERFFLFSHEADEVQPIASITKLMTALVFLENNPGWEEVYQIRADDKVAGGRLNLFLGDRLTIKDLFYTSLVASDNGATIALVHASGLSEEDFVTEMNEKARRLGLVQTNFQDPIGLSDGNVSTAREVALLARAAFESPAIRAATVSASYEFVTLDGREKKIVSTDDLLFDSAAGAPEVLAGKTGYTEEAGYCYVGYLRGDDGRTVISVVLGAADRSGRFRASRDLADWAFTNYQWGRRRIQSAGR